MNSADGSDASPGYSIRAVDRVCDILDFLANSAEGVTLTEVASVVGLPKSSTFRYLAALESRRYAARDSETSTYQLGLAFRPQSTHAVERLTEVAKPIIDGLRDEVGETVNIGVLEGSYAIHTAVAESRHMMRLAARVGERGYIHSTALGKVICCALPDAQVRSILQATGMPALTERTIVSADRYMEELRAVAEAGYGIDEIENQAFGRCVAVPIPGVGVPAGLSVSAPIDRLTVEGVPRVVAALKAAVAEITAQM